MSYAPMARPREMSWRLGSIALGFLKVVDLSGGKLGRITTQTNHTSRCAEMAIHTTGRDFKDLHVSIGKYFRSQLPEIELCYSSWFLSQILYWYAIMIS